MYFTRLFDEIIHPSDTNEKYHVVYKVLHINVLRYKLCNSLYPYGIKTYNIKRMLCIINSLVSQFCNLQMSMHTQECYTVSFLCLFLTVPKGSLQCVIVAVPGLYSFTLR